MRPELVRGDLAVDDRGEVAFVNDFDFASAGVRRAYMVGNHHAGFVRAWHGHRHEAKYVLVLSGAALVCCVEIDNWDDPSPDLEVSRFVLSERKPAVLAVPPGYVNGFMTLTDDAKLMFFSTKSLEESLGDDVRFPARLWDPWHVEER
jgi:dTDP-4-dehydrorhamnose 3,5-epimerase-like enzyme